MVWRTGRYCIVVWLHYLVALLGIRTLRFVQLGDHALARERRFLLAFGAKLRGLKSVLGLCRFALGLVLGKLGVWRGALLAIGLDWLILVLGFDKGCLLPLLFHRGRVWGVEEELLLIHAWRWWVLVLYLHVSHVDVNILLFRRGRICVYFLWLLFTMNGSLTIIWLLLLRLFKISFVRTWR